VTAVNTKPKKLVSKKLISQCTFWGPLEVQWLWHNNEISRCDKMVWGLANYYVW